MQTMEVSFNCTENVWNDFIEDDGGKGADLIKGMSESVRLKTKETLHKNCTLLEQIVSLGAME